MHGRGIIICSLLGAGVLLAGTPGYLAKVGPAELRFRFEQPAPAPVTLPPLPAPEQAQPSQSPAPATNPAATETPNAATNTAPPQATTVVAEPIFVQPTTPLITPQMFMQFFRPDTNGARRDAVIVPGVGFTPPLPPPSSSATFTQPDK